MQAALRGLGQQLRNVELSGLAAVENQGDGILRAVDAYGRVIVPGRFRVALEAAAGDIEQPIEVDARRGIDSLLQKAIAVQRGIGNFDNQANIGRRRMPLRIIAQIAAYDGEIRLRFARSQGNRLLGVHEPAAGNQPLEGLTGRAGGETVRRLLGAVGKNRARCSRAGYTGLVPEFRKLVKRLRAHYGEPELPPARGPFELVLWENACYLLPDSRRAAVFEGLRQRVGLDAESIWNADRDTLLELAKMGGMRPETRVFRWLEIARITRSQFGGDLDAILKLPYAKAKRALCQFPNIGEPGAEKILAQCGMAEGLPLESNGCRVLLRIGYGRAQKSYGAAYRSIQEALAGQLPRDAASLTRAHFLLRRHGQEICKTNGPACGECPVVEMCAWMGNAARKRGGNPEGLAPHG